MDAVDILQRMWDKKIVLQQRRNDLVSVGLNRDTGRILQTGTLERLNLGAHCCGEQISVAFA